MSHTTDHYTDQELLYELRAAIRMADRSLTAPEFESGPFPCLNTYRRRFDVDDWWDVLELIDEKPPSTRHRSRGAQTPKQDRSDLEDWPDQACGGKVETGGECPRCGASYPHALANHLRYGECDE